MKWSEINTMKKHCKIKTIFNFIIIYIIVQPASSKTFSLLHNVNEYKYEPDFFKCKKC